MPRRLRSVLSFALLALAFALPAHAKPPAWLTTLAAKPAAMPYGDATYAILLTEADYTLDKNGLVTKRARHVIRILAKDGRDAAFAVLRYDAGSEKVKSFQAWLIPARGNPIDYGKKQTTDTAVFESNLELYSESRQLLISAYDTARPGDIFAFEAITTEKGIFTQETWSFQRSAPVERSAIAVTLPDGWSARSLTFNRDPIAPVVNGQSWTWSLQQLPALQEETAGPPSHSLSPWLAIDFVPPAGTGTARVAFPSWQSVSEYFTPHYETASTPDPSIKARADALVAGAATPWEKIARLSRFAQQVNYISITLNASTAGGMIPRSSPRVLQCNYGDCKDKSALLRSLLRTQGIASHPVLVHSGDPTRVRPEWPSPHQFNHCILAIDADDSIPDLPGIIRHPALGRLLLFDPTNETTPPGWLASENLSGHALVLAGKHGALVELPSALPENSRLERTISARLDPIGGLSGTMTERFHGHAAFSIRRERKNVSASDYRSKIIEPWLRQTIPAARLTQLDATDETSSSRLDLTFAFEAHAYGKMMRDTLLVFKPVIVARRDSIALKRGKRTQPVLIYGRTFSERAEIEIPDGYAIDENFAAVSIKSPFGEYTASCKLQDKRLVFERQLKQAATILPASDYETARVFFEKILQAEQSPVVLRRL